MLNLRSTIVGLLLLCSSLASGNIEAGLCLPPQPVVDSPYHYLLALADALVLAKSGRDRATEVPSGAQNPIAALTDLMLGLKLAQRDYDCAASHLTPCLKSPDEAVKLSAETSTLVLRSLVEHDKQVLEHLKSLLDAKDDGASLGNYLDQQAELAARADDLWKTLPMGVIAATYAIVESDPGSDKLTRLSLTSDQRAEILKKLSGGFGATIQKGMQAGQFGLEASAAALYGFLSDTKWKSRDSK